MVTEAKATALVAAPVPVAPPAQPTLLPAMPMAQPTALPASPQAAPAVSGPQLADLARATTREAEQVAALERERTQILAEKARLARQYEGQLQELDRLKQQRASWRRDRLIRDQLRASHETAAGLAAADQRLRRTSTALAAQRQRLAAAVERELAAGPAAERRPLLARWRASAQPQQRRGMKKIVLPDERIDPLADPEELEDHAALLRQGEAELARELARLDQQGQRYRYMAALSAKRDRATELGRLDDDQPRRTTGRSSATPAAGGGDLAGSPEDQGPAPPPPEAPTPTPPSPDVPIETDPGDDRDAPTDTLSGLDVVLADVVDTSTLDALRAADRSGNPAVKARAAERASAQVRARLERLRAQRTRIQDRARELRAE
ncbi:MAG TPA: hypothetical protein VNM90_06045 [Haliangium sp.]|nr:hypothetical protein [Haliangium sp.]